MASKRKRAFAFFDKGYERNDLKVKEVVPNYHYRRNLWDMWRESRGIEPEPELIVEDESVAEVATPEAERAKPKVGTLIQAKARFIPQDAFDCECQLKTSPPC